MFRATIRRLLQLYSLVLAALPLTARATPPPPTEPVARDSTGWQRRHQEILREVHRLGEEAQIIFVGDSITEAWGHQAKRIWHRLFAGRGALNMGISGDQTGHLLWRLKNGALEGLAPRVAVVLIGVNNCYQPTHSADAIAGGVAAVITELRRRLPRTEVLLMALFPVGHRPGAMRRKVAAVNRRIAALADGHRVNFLDIGEKFVGPKGRISRRVMYDYLHLSVRGYRIWAAAMEPTLRRLLGAPTDGHKASSPPPNGAAAGGSAAAPPR